MRKCVCVCVDVCLRFITTLRMQNKDSKQSGHKDICLF